MALIMAAMAIWYPTHRWMRWPAGFGVAVGLALVWLSGARSTLLALVLVGFGFLALCSPARRVWSARLLCLGSAALMAYQIFYVVIPHSLGIEWSPGIALNEREHGGSIEARLVHWKLAFEMALQKPLTGWGGLHYATQHNVDAAHPHNIVLQWAAEWGWISTLLALGALVWWTRHLWLAMWQRLGGAIWPYMPMITAAWMATLAGWIDAMFSGTLTMPVSQVWWCFCLGIAWHSVIERSVLPVRPCSLQRSSFKNLLGHATVLALLTTTFISHKTTYQEKPEATLDQSFIKPRLWVSGSIK
ncbi:O-antigen ligase family protein [Ideonella paludis]